MSELVLSVEYQFHSRSIFWNTILIFRQPMCVIINTMYPRHGPGQREGEGGLGGLKGCGGHCWSDGLFKYKAACITISQCFCA